MIACSQAMKDAAAQSHAPAWSLTTSDGQDWAGRLLPGNLTRASGNSPRSRLGITIPETGRPSLIDQGMLPTGRDLHLSYRQHPTTETIRLFTGRLVESTLQRTASTWTMDAVGHEAVVAADQIRPGDVAVPAKVADLVRALVSRTLPTAVFAITGPALTANVPAGIDMDGDPWQIVDKACQSCGSEAYFDPEGICVVRAEPSLAQPGDHLRVGPGGTVTGYRAGHEAAYSRVELRYEDKADPPNVRYGVWEDHRPDSPTSVERIGRTTLREDYGSLLGLPPQAAADASAAALAARAAGRGRALAVWHIPRPWLEPGDTVEVTLSGGPTEAQMVASVDIPIGPGIQVTTMRNTAYRIEAA